MADIFNFFPCEINTEIFSRLPVDSILECKLVNKTWQSNIDKFLINNPSFADMHTCRLISPSATHNAASASSYCSFLVRKSQPDHNDTFPSIRRKKTLPNWKIIGSCNGLICLLKDYIWLDKKLDKKRNKLSPVSPNIYICNPVTREYTNLPPITHEYINHPIPEFQPLGMMPVPWQARWYIATGLGYIASTNDYKFVRITYDQDKMYVSIYKLGSCSWSIKEFENLVDTVQNTAVTIGSCFNGVLYWNTIFNRVIMSFDLETDELRRVAAPRDVLSIDEIVVFCGGIYVISTERYGSLGIWQMNVEEEDYTRKVNLGIGPRMGNFDTDFEIEEKIVMNYDYVKLFCYPRRRRRSCDYLGFVKINRPEMVPYMRSLVSLKAAGESVNFVPRRERKSRQVNFLNSMMLMALYHLSFQIIVVNQAMR